jgi:hypothetical protein
MANKTWNKSKAVMAVGWCGVCQKELSSNESGWIVNAEKKHFCHDGRDGSCFDKYVIEQKNVAEDASYEGS